MCFQGYKEFIPGVFCSLVVLGAVLVWKDRRYFLLLFFLGLACLVFVYGNFDGYAARHLDMPVLALHAFVSYSLAWLYRQFRVSAIFIFVLLITIQLLHIYPMLEFRRHYDGTLRLGTFVKSISPENAVFLTGDEAPFIEYYGKRKTMGYPIGHWGKLDGVFDEIERLMNRHIPVYVIPTWYELDGGTVAKSKFFEVGLNGGAILNRLIQKGVVEDISSTEVSFQLSNDLKINAIREIAKGDCKKILGIFTRAGGQFDSKLRQRFNVLLAGDILYEDFHHPELSMRPYMLHVFKLQLKSYGEAKR
ncbi:MAG: hypothetical protein HQL12_03305 [Candidatus Omnitrophica bacterium]|nr:hypothetical protein [Candidatus Omnitrophota bacterium]